MPIRLRKIGSTSCWRAAELIPADVLYALILVLMNRANILVTGGQHMFDHFHNIGWPYSRTDYYDEYKGQALRNITGR